MLAPPGPEGLLAQEKKEAPQGPPPSPVKVAMVTQKTVSTQITLIGTAEPIRESTVAAEVLDNWDRFLTQCVKVMPTDFKRVLQEMKRQQETANA